MLRVRFVRMDADRLTSRISNTLPTAAFLPPLATMAATAYFMPKNTPVALTAMIRFQASVL
jgi:hypothetical protein